MENGTKVSGLSVGQRVRFLAPLIGYVGTITELPGSVVDVYREPGRRARVVQIQPDGRTGSWVSTGVCDGEIEILGIEILGGGA